jgi:methanogenic corrinoid protein MtbC1
MVTPWGDLQRQVLRLTVNGQQAQLMATLEGLQLPLVEMYERILQPVIAQIEDRWFASDVTLDREWRCFRLIENLVNAVVPWPDRRKSFALVSCAVEGEEHAIGVQMVANLFDEAGWHIVNFGAGALSDMVATLLETRTVQAAAFSVTLDRNVPALTRLLAHLHTMGLPTVLLIGGPAVSRSAPHEAFAGADLVAPPLHGLVQEVERRIAGRTFASRPFLADLPPCLPLHDEPAAS